MTDKKKKWLMVGNWKMNPTTGKQAKALFSKIKKVANSLKNVETVICPPYIFLESLKTPGHRCVLGAQDLFWEADGAYTGFVSYLQLKHLGIRYVIVGHSERRALSETDAIVNMKVKAALRGQMIPIICVGEEARDNEGRYLVDLRSQIREALKDLPKTSMKDVVIAYEPLWAIGKGAKRDASPREVFEASIFIRKVLSDIYGTKSVPPTRILYGGSVDEKNIESFLKEGGIDGLLVGRASLSDESMKSLLRLAEANKR